MNPPKYPRTPYWPSSPAVASDGRYVETPGALIGAEVVITEKLDGQCALLHRGMAYARSTSSTAGTPWLAMARKRHAWKTARLDCLIYAEDIYGVHSIEYDPVTEDRTLYVFALRRMNAFASFDETVELARKLDIAAVPTLWRGKLRSVEQANRIVARLHAEPSELGPEREGVVLRLARGFAAEEFKHSIAKSVRKNHVQTDRHWRINWKPCAIIRP